MKKSKKTSFSFNKGYLGLKYKIALAKENRCKYEPVYLRSSEDVYRFIAPAFNGLDREKLVLICLDTRLKVINVSDVSIGNVDSSMSSPFEIFKMALLSNSNRIILAHNHPSGDPTPSTSDCDIFEVLRKGGAYLGIEVLDHVVIADDSYVSVADVLGKITKS